MGPVMLTGRSAIVLREYELELQHVRLLKSYALIFLLVKAVEIPSKAFEYPEHSSALKRSKNEISKCKKLSVS